jgi:uncharacterized protein YfiM (DUF2279 family)
MRLWTSWCWALVFLGLLVSRQPVVAQDSWLGADKGTHLAASAAFATAGYSAAMLVAGEPWQRAALGGGFAFALGVAKEIYDATGHGDASLRDLTWDVIGCAFGVGVAMLLDYALRSQPRIAPVSLRDPPLRAAALITW